VPKSGREVELERLRTLDHQLRERMAQRIAELAALRLEVAEAKRLALQRDEEWRRFEEWRRQQGGGGL
jgi:hypothetical protein